MKKIELITQKEEIKKLLFEIDDLFIPRISKKIEDFDNYSIKLINNAIIYQIKIDNQCAGILIFYINRKTKISYLTMIAVKNRYQNLGLGKELLYLYENISKKEEMKKLKLEVYDKNLNAINFYKKFGFKFLNKASNESHYMSKEII